MKPREIKAIYTDRMTLTINDDGLRITFGEAEYGKKGALVDEHYHTAVFMSPTTAKLFQALINESLEKHNKARIN